MGKFFSFIDNTVVTNFVITGINFVVSIIYATQLGIDDRGILAGLLVYPTLSLGLFGFGLQRSLPLWLSRRQFSEVTRQQICFCSLFLILTSMLMLIKFSQDIPVAVQLFCIAIVSMNYSLFTMTIIARESENHFNIARLVQVLALLVFSSLSTSIDGMIYGLGLSYIIGVIYALAVLPKCSKNLYGSEIPERTQSLTWWSILTSISANFHILYAEMFYEVDMIALAAVSMSYARLLTVVSSAAVIKSFFWVGETKGLIRKCFMTISFAVALLALSKFVFAHTFGLEFYSFRLILLFLIVTTLTAMIDIYAQKYLREGKLKVEIASRFIVVFLSLISISMFPDTPYYFLCFFIIFADIFRVIAYARS